MKIFIDQSLKKLFYHRDFQHDETNLTHINYFINNKKVKKK